MKRNISRRDAIRGIGAAGLVGLAGCSGGDGGDGEDGGAATPTPTGTESMSGDGESSMDTVRAAWIYLNEVGDLGWSWAHDQGRQASAQTYDWLETDYTEAVSPDDSGRVMQQYAQDDFDIIFATGFNFQDPMIQVARDNPDTLFEINTGTRAPTDNMGRYFGRAYEARFLAGMAAGMVTETNTLGYVAAFPIPQVLRGVNAHALGAAAVNEDVTMKVRLTNTWFDPPKEKSAANALIDEGVDVMAQHQDSPACVQAANEAGIWSTGYDAPMGEFGGEKYLTSPIWNWEKFHNPTLESVRNGTWEPDFYWKGLDSGVVSLDDWGPSVSDEIKSSVADTREGIISGDTSVWAGSKFEGESDEFFYQQLESYADPVEGTVPN